MTSIFEETTKKSSRTFYLSSLLFPKSIREDIFILYSFVRIADNYIDQIPSNIKDFTDYKNNTRRALSGEKIKNQFIEEFTKIVKKYDIPHKWIWDFFTIQEEDSKKTIYKNYKELSRFTYGVAEVIGLFMAKILNVNSKFYPAARELGKAMQLTNCIRDINEDLQLKRLYIPIEDLTKFNVNSVDLKINTNNKSLSELIKFECKRAEQLINKSSKAFNIIPKDVRLPIIISASLYKQILIKIYNDPLIIYKQKVKPNNFMIFKTIAREWAVLNFYEN